MQTLQVVQKNFEFFGLSPKLEPFNRQILKTFIISISGIASQWIFLLHEANGSKEYMESIYIVISCSGIVLSFASTTFNKEKLFLGIDSNDELIFESKF